MRRREFIALLGSAAAWPLAARAKQPRGIRKIGFLCLGDPAPEPVVKSLRAGLRNLGYAEGKDIQFEIRSANGKPAELAILARELVAVPVDVIVAYQTGPATAAKEATKEIPIVVQIADPVRQGFAASLSKPGGNITGVGGGAFELAQKDLELIREVLPSARRVGILANGSDPFHKPFLEYAVKGASQLDFEINSIVLKSGDEVALRFAEATNWKAEALIVQPSLPQQIVAALALEHRLPTFSQTPALVEAGGLASYSADLEALSLRCAALVDKILKGANPAELPIELATKFLLAVNLKTAKILGIKLPIAVMARADEVIE